ncbi:hypothetical protein D3C84_951630 [compost metagenome]
MIKACSMVGTMRMSVTRSRAMVRITSRASKAGTKTLGRPISAIRITLESAARWNIGAICRVRASVGTDTSAARAIAADHRFMCDSMTPLGCPVVPPV